MNALKWNSEYEVNFFNCLPYVVSNIQAFQGLNLKMFNRVASHGRAAVPQNIELGFEIDGHLRPFMFWHK